MAHFVPQLHRRVGHYTPQVSNLSTRIGQHLMEGQQASFSEMEVRLGMSDIEVYQACTRHLLPQEASTLPISLTRLAPPLTTHRPRRLAPCPGGTQRRSYPA